jgi:phosphohistidine phosphatase SixA
MRHGRIDQSADQRLSEEGKKQAQLTAKKMIAAGLSPDVILTSDAFRAIETGQILAEEFRHAGLNVTFRINTHKEYGNLLAVLETLNDERTVIVVSHEYSICEASYNLTGKAFDAHDGQARVIECHEYYRDGCREYSWKEIVRSNRHRNVETFSPNPA